MLFKIILISLAVIFLFLGIFISFEDWYNISLHFSADKKISPRYIDYMHEMKWILLSFSIIFLTTCIFWRKFKSIIGLITNFIASLSELKWCLLLFILALSIRAFFINFIQGNLASDAIIYDKCAIMLTEGKGFRWSEKGDYLGYDRETTIIPPGYVHFLAGLYIFSGHSIYVAKIANCILGSLLCLVVYFICKCIWNKNNSNLTSRVSSLVYAFFPSHIIYTVVLSTEILFTFLLIIAIWFLCSRIKTEWHFKECFISGLLFGLASYVRSVPLAFPLLFFVFMCIKKRSFISSIWRTIIFTLGIFFVLLPWTVRNYILTKHFIPLCSYGGLVFWMGNNERSTGEYMVPQKDFPKSYGSITFKDEYEHQSYFYKEGLQFIKENPIKWISLIPIKIMKLMALDTGITTNLTDAHLVNNNIVVVSIEIITHIYYLIALFFVVACLFINRLKLTTGEWLLYLFIFYWLFFHSLYISTYRYHFPIIPIIAMLAGRCFYVMFLRKINVER